MHRTDFQTGPLQHVRGNRCTHAPFYCILSVAGQTSVVSCLCAGKGRTLSRGAPIFSFCWRYERSSRDTAEKQVGRAVRSPV